MYRIFPCIVLLALSLLLSACTSDSTESPTFDNSADAARYLIDLEDHNLDKRNLAVSFVPQSRTDSVCFNKVGQANAGFLELRDTFRKTVEGQAYYEQMGGINFGDPQRVSLMREYVELHGYEGAADILRKEIAYWDTAIEACERSENR